MTEEIDPYQQRVDEAREQVEKAREILVQTALEMHPFESSTHREIQDTARDRMDEERLSQDIASIAFFGLIEHGDFILNDSLGFSLGPELLEKARTLQVHDNLI